MKACICRWNQLALTWCIDPPSSHVEQERVAQQHRIGNLLDGSTERSLGLHEIYEDKDGSMREEVGRKQASANPNYT